MNKSRSLCGLLFALALLVPSLTTAQDSVFTRTMAFAAKTGFRAVFAWSARQPVSGVVHYGTSPDALTESVVPVVGGADTAQTAVAHVETGQTYYYQIEDLLTGERSAIGSFEAVNAYNDWNGSTYTLDILVQLDTESLPPDIPADQALEDIAAGINIFAERLYDALDGYARLGTVLITDTNLDYPVNPPFFAPACDPTLTSLADVLIQTTVPFDSHTFSGWSIDNPCISFYVGRIGQLVVPWENDLHFGYVSTHEMMHYAFNAPDLYLLNSDADCANPDWDGSIMHNTGGFGGRWFLTELDRNPTLTPCNHGTQPWSWDALRQRYTQVPLNPEGPIDHVFDELPSGNPDGGALEIWILNREPGSSSLTRFTPEDQIPRCANDLPQVVDPEGDATAISAVPSSPAPSEPSLDVTSGRLTWDAASESITFHIDVANLEPAPPTGSDGHFFRFYFTYNGVRYQLRALRDILGQSFTLALEDNTVIATGLPGLFDFAADEVAITLSANRFSQAVPGAPRFDEGRELIGFEILAQRHLVALTLTADTATGTCSYRIGQEQLPPNRPPVAVDDSATVPEDGSVNVAVLANDSDPDGDAVALSGLSPARNGTVKSNADGTVNYRPNADFNGADSFRYTIRDGNGGSATGTVNVTVTPQPDAPDAVDDSAATTPGNPVTVAVLANDTDVDGDTLAIVAVTQGAHGSVTHNGTTVTYSPGGGFISSDSFTYTISDGNGGSDTATVVVSRADCFGSFADDLEPTPEPGWAFNNANGGVITLTTWMHTPDPRAASASHSFFSDASDASASKDDRMIAPAVGATALTRLSFWHRFATEQGFDGGVLEVSTDNGATWRDVLAAGGSFVAGGYNGSLNALGGRAGWTGFSAPVDAMSQVVVNLGALAGNTTLVRWRLATDANLGNAGWWVDDVSFTDIATDNCQEPPNRAPVAADDEALTQMNTAVTIDVLANDSDPDGDALTVSAVGQPANGSASTDGAGVTYTPNAGFSGTDVFTYTASDGNGGSDTAQVTVRVNAPPQAQDDAATTNEDQAATIEVLANDHDPDSGDSLTVSAVGQPAHGSASANADGTVSYVPDPNFHGADSFTYTADDGNGGSDSATVTVTVQPVNDAPNAVDDSATTTRNKPVRIAVLANDSDVDGDSFTISSVSPAPNGTVSIKNDGTIQYRPRANFTGTDSFTYTIRDANGGADTATVTVTVTE
jgi:Big-like domain-containing protein